MGSGGRRTSFSHCKVVAAVCRVILDDGDKKYDDCLWTGMPHFTDPAPEHLIPFSSVPGPQNFYILGILKYGLVQKLFLFETSPSVCGLTTCFWILEEYLKQLPVHHVKLDFVCGGEGSWIIQRIAFASCQMRLRQSPGLASIWEGGNGHGYFLN